MAKKFQKDDKKTIRTKEEQTDEKIKISGGKSHKIDEKAAKTALENWREKIIQNAKHGSKYMAGQLSQIIEKQYDKNNRQNNHFYLTTPFGDAYIYLTKADRETHVNGSKLDTYEKICNKICETKDIKLAIKNFETIYDYLNFLSDDKIKTIEQFNDKVKEKFDIEQNLENNKDEEKIKPNYCNALKYLCAILMVSEPYRFEDDGGYSRACIRLIYEGLKNNNENIIKKVIGNKGIGGTPDAIIAQKGGKQKALNQKNGKNEKEDIKSFNNNKKKMELTNGYMSDNEDNEDNNKKEYSLRSKGLSEEEKQIYENSFHGKLGKFIKNKKANMRTNIRENRKINRRSRKINRKRTRGNKSKSKKKKQK